MAITDLDPKLLVEAHNRGDDEAFAQIVRTHHATLLSHAVRLLHDGAAAEDAVQETLVRAYRALHRFEGDYNLRAWLHRILVNVCHDEGARRQRDGRLFDRVSSQAVIDVEPADIDIDRADISREVVAAAIAGLPTSYREALVLRYVEELSYEEVAAATGVTEGNARIRVMRGRAALKRALTSSHAVVLAVAPWLRRGGRGSVDLPSLGSSLAGGAPSVVSSAPLLARAADTAPQVADRVASLPQVLGLVATMAVPIAAPVVGDQVAGWVSRPPAVAAPAAVDPLALDAAAAAAAATVAPASAAPSPPVPPTAVVTPPDTTAPPTTGPAPTAPTAGSSTTVAGPEGTATSPTTNRSTVPTSAAPTSAAPTTAPPPTIAAPPKGVLPPTTVAAPPVALTSTLSGGQITIVGDPRTDLAGAVSWSLGGTITPGQLRGTLVFDEPAALPADEVAPPEEEVAEGAPPATDAPAQPVTGPRRFTGQLVLALDDGRSYRLSLADGVLDVTGAGTAATASFELRDACDVVVATGTLSGDVSLQQAPLPSALTLSLAGRGPAAPPPCG